MLIQTHCPTCQATFTVAAEMHNKWVHCASCKATFQVRADEPDSAARVPTPDPEPAPAPPLAEDPPFSRLATYPEPTPPQPEGGGSGWVGMVAVFFVLALLRTASCSSRSTSTPRFEPAQPRFQVPAVPDLDDHHAKLKAMMEQLIRDQEAARKPAEKFQEQVRPNRAVLEWMLESPNLDERRRALRAFAQFEPDVVVGRLGSRDGEVARQALMHDGVKVEPSVFKALGDASEKVRLDACEILGKKGSEASLGPLADAERTDRSAKVREAAGKAFNQVAARLGIPVP